MTELTRPAALLELTSYLLSQAAAVSKRELDAELVRRGMRLRHMAILAALADSGPISQLDLGLQLHLDPSDVTATVDDLQAARLVVREVDPADRRRRLTALTPAGRRTLRDLQATARAVADNLLAPLSANRRRQLHGDLLKILTAVDARAAPGRT